MDIAVLGGGNGSLAAAADLADQGHSVRLWRRDAAVIEALNARGALRLKDFKGERDVKLSQATSDLAEAVDGAAEGASPVPVPTMTPKTGDRGRPRRGRAPRARGERDRGGVGAQPASLAA